VRGADHQKKGVRGMRPMQPETMEVSPQKTSRWPLSRTKARQVGVEAAMGTGDRPFLAILPGFTVEEVKCQGNGFPSTRLNH